MGDVVAGITDAIGLTDTEDPGEQARKAAGTQVAYQQEALEYLKEREALPQQFREQALTQIGGMYGLGGIPREYTNEEQMLVDELARKKADPNPTQQRLASIASLESRISAIDAQREQEAGAGATQIQEGLIERARMSPLYGAIMGTQEAGEEAILRQASVTGGLRSGNVQAALYDQAQQLENRALLEAYGQQRQGLAGLASLPSMAPQIAAGTAGIGQTMAQGRVAQAQADIAAQNQLFGDIIGGTQAALTGFDVGGFSDVRLKSNVEWIGNKNGYNWYKWDWNEAANDLGLNGSEEGLMAHEVMRKKPEAIGEREGYITVNYEMLGV